MKNLTLATLAITIFIGAMLLTAPSEEEINKCAKEHDRDWCVLQMTK